MKPTLLAISSLAIVTLTGCSVSPTSPSKHAIFKPQGDLQPLQADPNAVSHAVMNAKIRVTLAKPQLMGEKTQFEEIQPFLVLALETRPSNLEDLEKTAGKKIVSLGTYPWDYSPEDSLIYEE